MSFEERLAQVAFDDEKTNIMALNDATTYADVPSYLKEQITMDKQSKLLGVGITGTVIAALCCFTPILGILLGVVGLSGLLGYLDYVLLPALVFFIGLTVYALYRNKLSKQKPDDSTSNQQDRENK